MRKSAIPSGRDADQASSYSKNGFAFIVAGALTPRRFSTVGASSTVGLNLAATSPPALIDGQDVYYPVWRIAISEPQPTAHIAGRNDINETPLALMQNPDPAVDRKSVV